MASTEANFGGGAATGKELDLAESVAGEEDPGASIEPAPTMSHQYSAQVLWQRDGQEFLGNHYSRRHLLRFDGGAEVIGSSSPHVVPVPHSDPAGVDPEEAFVASLSSCHMLWFLSLASRQGFVVERYTDDARGVMARNAAGKMAMITVTLQPEVIFSGSKQPTREQLDALHHQAHEECFIANSVTTEVRCEPVYPDA
jgi:organic hydroperoxide reductase OsmC/OhrA